MFLVAADGAVAVHIESGAVRRLPIEPRSMLGIAIDPEHATVARATHEGVDLWALDGVGTGVVASVPERLGRPFRVCQPVVGRLNPRVVTTDGS